MGKRLRLTFTGRSMRNRRPFNWVPANAVHVTLWATTPYFEAETVDVELNFPLSMHMVKRALRESFQVIPEWATEILPTVPQLGEDYASFIVFPGWLRQANLTVQVIDAREVHGPVFSFYHEGSVSRAAVLKKLDWRNSTSTRSKSFRMAVRCPSRPAPL